MLHQCLNSCVVLSNASIFKWVYQFWYPIRVFPKYTCIPDTLSEIQIAKCVTPKKKLFFLEWPLNCMVTPNQRRNKKHKQNPPWTILMSRGAEAHVPSNNNIRVTNLWPYNGLTAHSWGAGVDKRTHWPINRSLIHRLAWGMWWRKKQIHVLRQNNPCDSGICAYFFGQVLMRIAITAAAGRKLH